MLGTDTSKSSVYSFPLYTSLKALQAEQKPSLDSPRSKIYQRMLAYFQHYDTLKNSSSPRSVEKKSLLNNSKTNLVKQISKSLSILLEPVTVTKLINGHEIAKVTFPYLFKLKNLKKNIYQICKGIEILLQYQKYSIRFTEGRIPIHMALEKLTLSKKIKSLFTSSYKKYDIRTIFEATVSRAATERTAYYKEIKSSKSNRDIILKEMREKLDLVEIEKKSLLQSLAPQTSTSLPLPTISNVPSPRGNSNSLPLEHLEKLIPQPTNSLFTATEPADLPITVSPSPPAITKAESNIIRACEMKKEDLKKKYLYKVLLDRLIQKITPHATLEEEIDWSITTPKKLLATYRYFMTTEELFNYIKLSIQDRKLCSSHKRTLIHICRMWLRDTWNLNYLYDQNIADILTSITVATRAEIARIAYDSDVTDELLEEQTTALECMLETLRHNNRATLLPVSHDEIQPHTFEKLTLFSTLPKRELKALLHSYQMHFYSMALRVFTKIPLHELVFDAVVHADEKPLYCSSIIEYTDTLNRASSFVVQEIMLYNPEEIKVRYHFYCRLAYQCMLHRDYFSVMSIMSALNTSIVAAAVKKLKITKPKELEILDKLTDCIKNHASLREAIEENMKNNQPYIPFLGILQKDLNTFQLGNNLTSVNFDKSKNVDELQTTVSTVNNPLAISRPRSSTLEFDTALIQMIYSYLGKIETNQKNLIKNGPPKQSPLELAILDTKPLDESLNDLLYEKAKNLNSKKNKIYLPAPEGIVTKSRSIGDYFTLRRKSVRPPDIKE
jgi:hypothetical protein